MGQTQFRSDDTVKWWLGFGDGSDGDYSSAGNTTDAPVDSSCSGTAGSTSLSATNASFAAGKPVLIHQTRGTGAGNWELNQIDSYTAGTITLKKVLQNTYTDSGASQAQVIQLKQYNNFTQNTGHTLTAKAWDGNIGGIIAFLAKGTVTITGTLLNSGNTGPVGGGGGVNSVAGLAGRGYIGGTAIENSGAYKGEGTTGAITVGTSANGSGGGGALKSGGTDGDGGCGGGGGNGTAGAAGQTYGSGATAGSGGGTAGAAALTTIVPGGGGGGGSQGSGSTFSLGAGGSGGGICLIICKEITISGSINNNGGNGGGGGSVGGAGGAGAGGSVLIKAETATLGTTKITASGGTGGSNAGSYKGGNGGVGRIHLDYSTSYTGTTTPTLDYTLDTTIKDAGGSSAWFMFM